MQRPAVRTGDTSEAQHLVTWVRSAQAAVWQCTLGVSVLLHSPHQQHLADTFCIAVQEALLAAKLSAADAAAQAAVDDMLAEQALDGEDVESKEAEEGGGIAEDLEDSFIEEEDADDAESDSARRLL